MKSRLTLAFLAGALTVAAVPSMALAEPVHRPSPDYQPAPSSPPQGKAFGFYCQGKSKKHVKGEMGTEFSRCVKAMARAAHNEGMSPGRACKGLSKKHVKGEKGTEFSRCVKAAAKLRRDQEEGTA